MTTRHIDRIVEDYLRRLDDEGDPHEIADEARRRDRADGGELPA